MPAEQPSILVVEDEANIRELVALHLKLENTRPIEVADGTAALDLARGEKYDLIILDLMLPGIDGVTLCRAIRRDSPNSRTPILMLTARQEESDKVLGLDSGADDYMAKPFGVRELMASVRALLRRRTAVLSRFARRRAVALRHIKSIRQAQRQGRDKDVDLTWHEFQLLQVLLQNPGIVFSREALLRKVWKDETYVTDRSVDTLVKRLRKKIEEDPANPTVILTVWGSGYKVADVD